MDIGKAERGGKTPQKTPRPGGQSRAEIKEVRSDVRI